MYMPVATSAIQRGGLPTDSGDSVVALDQVPRWNDADQVLGFETSFSSSHFPDPLASPSRADSGDGSESVSKFPVDDEVNSKIYLWRGNPWNLEVDAVVNSTNENMDEAHSSPGLHDAAGPGLAEECATLYDFCFKLAIVYKCLKGGTVRRFLEKQKNNIIAVVFCTVSTTDTEIYKRLLPLYFPRDKHEEQVALSKLPADVGDENGETISDERKIRIKPLPKRIVSRPPEFPADHPVSDVGLVSRNSSHLDSFLDPAFMSMIKDPDQRRMEQWEKTAEAQRGWNCAKLIGYGDLGGPSLSAAEEYSLHSRYLSKANSLNLSEIAEMKIVKQHRCDSVSSEQLRKSSQRSLCVDSIASL
uniref:Uncharacterized protein n=1 Tax=Glycine max TaxID=3847 RepID=A0A0R0JD55_SOYBN